MRVIAVIIKEWLVRNNHDGLYNHEYHCSCSVDDVLCCDGKINKCVAAKKAACDCEEKCEFHLKPVE